MKYTVIDMNHDEGYVDVEFEDKSWARIHTPEGTEFCAFQEMVFGYSPSKVNYKCPSFLEIGYEGYIESRDGKDKDGSPILPPEEPQWLKERKAAYGSGISQLEFITENGLEAWQEHVKAIKEAFPKHDEEKVY